MTRLSEGVGELLMGPEPTHEALPSSLVASRVNRPSVRNWAPNEPRLMSFWSPSAPRVKV